jgi:hypothetical protein
MAASWQRNCERFSAPPLCHVLEWLTEPTLSRAEAEQGCGLAWMGLGKLKKGACQGLAKRHEQSSAA